MKFSEGVLSNVSTAAWNSLPHELQSAQTIATLKPQVKTHLFYRRFEPYLLTDNISTLVLLSFLPRDAMLARY